MTYYADLDPNDDFWPKKSPQLDSWVPSTISLDLDMPRSAYSRVAADLLRLQAEPNLDPHTRSLLTGLTAKIRSRTV